MFTRKKSLVWKFIFISTVLVLFSIGPKVLAQQQEPNDQAELFEMSLEELMEVEVGTVYSASKYKQKVTEAPASVTIITADEIRLYGHRNLADILRSVRGFYTSNDRNYEYLGVRGFGRPGDYNTRILILIDGHRTNENIGDSASIGNEALLDVDLIDRVEIIRGPGSALYGSSALLAVVNVITKKGADYKGAEFAGEWAEHDTKRGRITYGNVFDNEMDLLVSATKFDSGDDTLYFKEFDAPSTGYGRVRHDDEEFYNFFAKLIYGEFTFEGARVEREKEIPTGPWDTVFGDQGTTSWDDYTFIAAKYEHDFSDKLSMMARLAYNHYNYDGDWTCYWGGPYLNYDWWKGRWWEGELQFVAEPWEKHKLTWGAEFRYNVRQDQKNWDSEVYLNDRRHSWNYGLYFQDEFKVLDDLTFIGGLRYDEYSTFGSKINPRLAFIYDLSERTILKLLYGEAFRAPNAYELYYHDGGWSAKPSLNLEPETIKTYEAVIEHQLSQNLWGTVSGFYYKMDDLIDQTLDTSDGMLEFTNLSEVKAEGVEVGLQGRWDNGVRGRVSYTYVTTEDKDTGGSLENSPKHLGKLNVIVPLIKDKLFAGIETQYNGKAKTLSGHHADDFVIVNLTLTYENVIEGMEVAVGLYNLFDKEYSNLGFGEHTQDTIEQNGRLCGVKLTYRF